ncbi:Alpha/Beta hydrolase protein [Cercophora scortea]|uniref:Carboxylic ester hydrolase n=1 Tax=Cercophora scortea TaxID=314031 RepID=A0AAE0J259_9PEZI|nr:Alpha/Beta hydrolase protein [Cercophora scortea]
MAPLFLLRLFTSLCLVSTLTAALPTKQNITSPGKAPVVDLNYTVYEGLSLANGVSAFLGMRYASPPVGDLRWRAPAKPSRTSTVQKATQFQPICLGINNPYPAGGQDEDCLFVNVWAPTNATSQSQLPVWVFIQGGGYVSLTNANWNGAEVVQKSGHNIVMVNFNYRVGMWGFLASERVREDGDLNAGLLDQRMLLAWVKAHIASFGGDPNHVVIHGASAGAGSVAMHMVAYGGRNDDLFVGAMAESVFFPAQPAVTDLEYQFDRVAQQTGCDSVPRDNQLSCLRGKDVAALQAANHVQQFPGRPDPPLPLFYFTPCIDGDLLRDYPYKLFRDGRFVKVPVLFGTSANEGSVFAVNADTQADVSMFLRNNYPHLSANETDAVLAHYPLLPSLPNHAPWYPTASQAYGEATFICPNVNVLNEIHAGMLSSAATTLTSTNTTNTTNTNPIPITQTDQPPVFAYRFNVQDEGNTAAGLGVPHLFDAAAIFGPDNIGGASASYKTYNAPVVPLFMSYWISFIRRLDPNPHRSEGSPVWRRWGGGGGEMGVVKDGDRSGGGGMSQLIVETGNTRMETVPADERVRCLFWLSLGDTLEQM